MIRLFSLIALLVLSVSVSSAFVESAYAEEHEPIRIILDITYQNILDSIAAAEEDGDLKPEEVADLIDSVENEYQTTVDLINGDDVVAAKESVLQAMASFEVIAVGIESLEDQASTQLPPGFGSASDSGITQGQGLGVGGIPSGILKQITAIMSAVSFNEAAGGKMYVPRDRYSFIRSFWVVPVSSLRSTPCSSAVAMYSANSQGAVAFMVTEVFIWSSGN